jgi:hypothetical protein
MMKLGLAQMRIFRSHGIKNSLLSLANTAENESPCGLLVPAAADPRRHG